jgi:hypothetical protein
MGALAAPWRERLEVRFALRARTRVRDEEHEGRPRERGATPLFARERLSLLWSTPASVLPTRAHARVTREGSLPRCHPLRAIRAPESFAA